MPEFLEDLDLVYIYLVIVGLIGLLSLVRVLVWLRKTEQKRKSQILTRRVMDAIRTSSPVEDPNELARERGVQSVESRFTVTRRLVVPLIVILTAAMMSLPFLTMVPAAIISVLAAIVTVSVGIAARPLVENAIAGLTISFSQLFRIGDTVKVDEWYGTIEDINITHTTIKVWDWRRYIVPNSQMLQSKFLNYSLYDRYLWSYVEFWVAFDADLDLVKYLALQAPKKSGYFAGHESPRFWLMEMGKEGFRCWVAAWANSPSDGWLLSHDIRSDLIAAFKDHGIRSHGWHQTLTHSPAEADSVDDSEDTVKE